MRGHGSLFYRLPWVLVPWKRCRGVAQPGRAPGSGPGGRRFKSSLPDQYLQQLAILATLQIEPLVRLLWVPQSKCRSRRGLASVDNPRFDLIRTKARFELS